MIQISKPSYSKSTQKTICSLIKTGKLAQGKFVEQFENEFAKYIGCEFGVALNSGTSALHLALLSLGVGPGDEVIVPSFTFAATANVVLLVGARPIFADVNLTTHNIEWRFIEPKITKKTKAIILVHLFGLPCDSDEIIYQARKNNILIVEDCAQACGASYKGSKVGNLGDVGCFSFYSTKNLSTGEGGMIVTNNVQLARKVRLYRNQGMIDKYDYEIAGYNNRMQEISAVLGLAQLFELDSLNYRRIRNANFYDTHIPNNDLIRIPKFVNSSVHVYHQYTLQINHGFRDSLYEYLNLHGIQSKIYYPKPLHKFEMFHHDFFLSNAEFLSKVVLSIPVHSNLKKKNLSYIVGKIQTWLSIVLSKESIIT